MTKDTWKQSKLRKIMFVVLGVFVLLLFLSIGMFVGTLIDSSLILVAQVVQYLTYAAPTTTFMLLWPVTLWLVWLVTIKSKDRQFHQWMHLYGEGAKKQKIMEQQTELKLAKRREEHLQKQIAAKNAVLKTAQISLVQFSLAMNNVDADSEVAARQIAQFRRAAK